MQSPVMTHILNLYYYSFEETAEISATLLDSASTDIISNPASQLRNPNEYRYTVQTTSINAAHDAVETQFALWDIII